MEAVPLMALNSDIDHTRVVERVRQLEYTLDVALKALDASASMRDREAARCTIREVLVKRRTLRQA